MFNTEWQVIDITVVEHPDHLELQQTIGLAVPQDGGVSFLPAGQHRFPLGKEASIKIGKTLQEKGEALPDPPKKSDLVIPENAQKIAQEAKAGPDGSKR